MSNFKTFNDEVSVKWLELSQHQRLFVVDVSAEDMWNAYLESFSPEDNPVYKERREFDCNCCRHALRDFGRVVAIDPNTYELISVWDFEPSDPVFQPSVHAMRNLVKTAPIKNIFVHSENQIGGDSFQITPQLKNWNHFGVPVSQKYKKQKDVIPSLLGEAIEAHDMLKRAVSELKVSAVDTVLELIATNSIHRGPQMLPIVQGFKNIISGNIGNDNYVWFWSQSNSVVSRIRNTAIGTLLVDLSEDVPENKKDDQIDVSVRKYEKTVAGDNYQRPNPVFTSSMLEKARKAINDAGYERSFDRRFAEKSDVGIDLVCWVNRTVAPSLKDAFSSLETKTTTKSKPKAYDSVEKIPMAKLLELLPTFTSIEVLFKHDMQSKLVSLIAPMYEDAKSPFQWKNGLSWTYNGNVADSSIKQAVAKAGGNVNGILRASLAWTHGDDLDLHCVQSHGRHIYFGDKSDSRTTGALDIDITRPIANKLSVENIVWTDKSKMPDGEYDIYVHCYRYDGSSKDGFSAEVVFDGVTHTYRCDVPLRQNQQVKVAVVTLKKGVFSIKNALPVVESAEGSAWGLKFNEFVPVELIMNSPNYLEKETGNPHTFFFLKNCINDGQPSGFFNEQLDPFFKGYRKVMEALTINKRVEKSAEQLSGVGFSTSLPFTFTVRVESNNIKRVFEVSV